MDRAIRTVLLNHSVHSSVSEHQECTKFAKSHTLTEEKNEIIEARTQVWWSTQGKKCFSQYTHL